MVQTKTKCQSKKESINYWRPSTLTKISLVSRFFNVTFFFNSVRKRVFFPQFHRTLRLVVLDFKYYLSLTQVVSIFSIEKSERKRKRTERNIFLAGFSIEIECLKREKSNINLFIAHCFPFLTDQDESRE